jgi:cAMP-dependent protein kinase regulator
MGSFNDDIHQLQELIDQEKPQDYLQFCADYFNKKLSLQRQQLWNQKQKSDRLGINLFPDVGHIKLHHSVSHSQPTFKSPFGTDPYGSTDPHSNINHAITSPETDSSAPAPAPVPGNNLFKNNFTVANPSPATAADSPDPVDHLASLPKKSAIPSLFNVHRRTSVSAEALNPDKFKTDSWKPPVNNLTPAQRVELSNNLSSNFLFKQLDESSKKTVVAALQKKSFAKDFEIIKQGDQGDYFYIVESGTVDFYVNGSKVSSSKEGSSFGELALMYNSPRAATVVAVTDVTAWALDRLTFRRILLEGTFNRRLMYEDFLKDVLVLSSLTSHERSKLADALSTEIYHKGDKIVCEGEKGESFYFIESGNCQVSKKDEGVLTTLSKGDYFGEIALLNDLPRQATVEALDTVIVATLGKSGFERLLGNVLHVLKEQDPRQ